MHSYYHVLTGAATKLPINAIRPIISFSPVVLPVAGRQVDLNVRVTVPSTGSSLPIILLSHGHGKSNYLSSLAGYAPLAEFWAAHGFAVFQPTHLSSAHLGLNPGSNEMFYKQRADDMVQILDNLDTIEKTVPGLQGRLDQSRVAVAGHSLGSLTAAMLMGAKNTDPRDGSTWHRPETRIKAGIILGGVGNGGSDLSENGQGMIPFYGPDFSSMTTPALVVYGDADVSPHLTNRGADWHADQYTHAPAPKSLLELKGGGHGMGGISGWDAKEADDESPERLGVVQRMTWAYLMSQFYKEDDSWEKACRALGQLESQGRVETK